jgi:hypothetical protein
LQGNPLPQGTTISIRGTAPPRTKFKNGRFIVKRPCNLIPGPITVTVPQIPPGAGCTNADRTSPVFQCDLACPSGQ